MAPLSDKNWLTKDQFMYLRIAQKRNGHLDEHGRPILYNGDYVLVEKNKWEFRPREKRGDAP